MLPLERVGRVRDRPTGHAANLRLLLGLMPRGRASFNRAQLHRACLKRPERAKPAADPAVSVRVRISVSGVRGHHYQAGPELHDCMGPNLCTPNLLRSKVFPKRISAQLPIFL